MANNKSKIDDTTKAIDRLNKKSSDLSRKYGIFYSAKRISF